MTPSSDISGRIDLHAATPGSDVRVVTVAGRIDTPAGLELAHFLTTHLALARLVIVDLDGVQLLGSAGLSALFEANELAAQQGRALRLVCHSGIVNRALETAGLRECFSFVDSVSDAVQESPRRPGVVDVRAAAQRLHRRRRARHRTGTVARRVTAPRGH